MVEGGGRDRRRQQDRMQRGKTRSHRPRGEGVNKGKVRSASVPPRRGFPNKRASDNPGGERGRCDPKRHATMGRQSEKATREGPNASRGRPATGQRPSLGGTSERGAHGPTRMEQGTSGRFPRRMSDRTSRPRWRRPRYDHLR